MKNNMMKASAIALAMTVFAALPATPAAAQSRGAAAAATRYGVFNADGAINASAAMQNAVTQIRTTYAAQIQARDARATALNAELQPLLTAAQTEAARTPRNEAAYNTAVQNYSARAQAAQAELEQLAQPYQLAVAYAREQIAMRLREALLATATARSLDMVLVDDAVAYRAETLDVTSAVTGELNRLIPTVQIVPPAGYRPGDLARAAAAAATPAAPTTPAATPDSR